MSPQAQTKKQQVDTQDAKKRTVASSSMLEKIVKMALAQRTTIVPSKDSDGAIPAWSWRDAANSR